MTDAFEKAAEDVKNLKQTPTNDELLQLYALYKQGTVGDVNIEKPTGLFNMKEKAKWDAWNAKKGTSSEAAKEAYIALSNKLISSYGLK